MPVSFGTEGRLSANGRTPVAVIALAIPAHVGMTVTGAVFAGACVLLRVGLDIAAGCLAPSFRVAGPSSDRTRTSRGCFASVIDTIARSARATSEMRGGPSSIGDP